MEFSFFNSSLFPNFVYDITFPRVSLRHPLPLVFSWLLWVPSIWMQS
uniref:Uncharacterized protein n=1 Tax=Vitis vinifera TaxID=29760 RepID=F6HD06_VITVI